MGEKVAWHWRDLTLFCSSPRSGGLVLTKTVLSIHQLRNKYCPRGKLSCRTNPIDVSETFKNLRRSLFANKLYSCNGCKVYRWFGNRNYEVSEGIGVCLISVEMCGPTVPESRFSRCLTRRTRNKVQINSHVSSGST